MARELAWVKVLPANRGSSGNRSIRSYQVPQAHRTSFCLGCSLCHESGARAHPTPIAYPISKSTLALSVVTSAITNRVKRIALQISQKMIWPEIFRSRHEAHFLSLATLFNPSYAFSIVDAIVTGSLGYGDAFTSDMSEAHGKVVGLALNGAQTERKPS